MVWRVTPNSRATSATLPIAWYRSTSRSTSEGRSRRAVLTTCSRLEERRERSVPRASSAIELLPPCLEAARGPPAKGGYGFERLIDLTAEVLFKVKCAIIYVSQFITHEEIKKHKCGTLGTLPAWTNQNLPRTATGNARSGILIGILAAVSGLRHSGRGAGARCPSARSSLRGIVVRERREAPPRDHC